MNMASFLTMWQAKLQEVELGGKELGDEERWQLLLGSSQVDAVLEALFFVLLLVDLE